MTDFSALPDEAINQGSPLTEDAMFAMRDRPKAAAEGAANAYKFAKKVERYVVNGGGTTTIGGLDAFGGATLRIYFGNSAGVSRDIEIEFSDNGTTFYGLTEVFSIGSGVGGSGEVFIDFASGSLEGASQVDSVGVGTLSATVAGMSTDVTHLRVSTGSGLSVAVMIEMHGGQSAS